MQNAKSCLIPNYIFFNPSKQFVSSGKLFYREIKQSQQLKRVQQVSTKEREQRDHRQSCTCEAMPICSFFSFFLALFCFLFVWCACGCLNLFHKSPIWETYLRPWVYIEGRKNNNSLKNVSLQSFQWGQFDKMTTQIYRMILCLNVCIFCLNLWTFCQMLPASVGEWPENNIMIKINILNALLSMEVWCPCSHTKYS